MEIKIQIISSENVKPSSPTPPHLRNLTLSFLDQKYNPVFNPTLLFYGAPKEAAAPSLDITRLKTCLSQTLTTFYPLAGRFQTWGTILCNDEGIPFVEVEVNCPLSTVVGSISSSSSAIDLSSFYPPKENLISSGIHVAIQVNKFSCGGFAIGWYHTHKVTDGVSAATFFRHWSGLVTERYEDVGQALPDFNAAVIAFPPVPEEVKAVTSDLNPEKEQVEEKTEEKAVTLELNHEEKQAEEKTKEKAVTLKLNHEEKQEEEKTEEKVVTSEWNLRFDKRIVVGSFVLNNKAVTELQAKSISDEVPNPSRFLSVTSFLWKHLVSASAKEGQTMLTVIVDLRSKSVPPLPKQTMGNIIGLALAQAEKQAQLPEFAAEIHGSISKMKDLVTEFQGENREVAVERYAQHVMYTVMEHKVEDVFFLIPWCKSSGFIDMDFGFGKPQWIVPIDETLNHDHHRNSIILTEYVDSEGDVGFEAWLFLEEQRMKFLENCPEFLAFASPNFQLNN